MTAEFLPIDAYGAIGNDNRCALVGENGSVDWCPFPHVESPSLFTAILDDDEGGRFRIEPTDDYESTQSYIEGTNVLQTTFETDEGTAVVTDFMPVREGEAPDERFQQSLYRKVEVPEGSVELAVEFAPRFDYGRAETTLGRTDDGDLVARAVDDHGTDDGVDERTPTDDEEHTDTSAAERPDASADELDREREALYLHGVQLDRVDESDATATKTLSMETESVRWFCCQYGAPDYRSTEDYQSILEETIDYWRTWLDGCKEGGADLLSFEDEWQQVLTRSALVLKLLIHEETGAIPAAPTTSLPEELGGELNWDYRYNWIRDAKFTVQALHMVGQQREAHQYFEWFRDIGHEDPAEIQPLYDLHGGAEIDEEVLDHLSGYRDSTPVRIGNAAAEQKQLDIYGTIVQGIYETIRYENGLTDEDWESVHALADHVCDHWTEKGEGIWEFRDLHEHFVHSKLLCWVALDRALRLAEEYDRDGPLEHWEDERAEIREAIETRGYDEEAGSFLQFFGADDALDATALLIPLYDFLPADDERVLSTIDAVIDELTTEDGLVVRFANSPARPRESGAFVLCSCWLIDALVLADRTEEAREYFESLLDYASPLGMYAEMIHTDDGSLLGNFPQAFSHIGVINSAIYLACEDESIRDVMPEDLEAGDVAPLFRQHGG